MKSSVITNAQTKLAVGSMRAKMELQAAVTPILVSASTSLTSIGLAGFCDIDGNGVMQKFLKMFFNITLFGGIIMAGVGVATLLRTVVALASGEQAQPGAIGKGVGFLVGGIILMALKKILTGMIGSDPTTMTFL